MTNDQRALRSGALGLAAAMRHFIDESPDAA